MSNITPQEWSGYCPICHAATTFRSNGPWHREQLICINCPGYSVPRERALMLMLDQLRPDWRNLVIHESSPAARGVSVAVGMQCRHYSASQFFPDIRLGSYRGDVRCENLEALTFGDQTVDIMITQDVMEHVFNPDVVYREVHRILRVGGLYLHTTPISQNMPESKRAAQMTPSGEIHHLLPPEYHGNPIDDAGSLVTFYWGRDLPDLIASWAPFSVQMTRFNDKRCGILGEMTEVIACERPVPTSRPIAERTAHAKRWLLREARTLSRHLIRPRRQHRRGRLRVGEDPLSDPLGLAASADR